MSGPRKVVWECDRCDWYDVQFVFDDPKWASTPDRTHQEALARHKKAAHPKKNPLSGLWEKRNSASGYFTALKRKGIGRVKREN